MTKKKHPPATRQGFTAEDLVGLLQRKPTLLPTTPFPVFLRSYEDPPVCTMVDLSYDEEGVIVTGKIDSSVGATPEDFESVLAKLSDAMEIYILTAPSGPSVATYPKTEAGIEAEAQAQADLAVVETPPQGSSMVVASPTRETLRVNLTEMEIVEHARAAARANSELLRLEEELKAIKSDYKAQMDKEQAKLNEHSGKVNNGWEMRPVACTIYKNYQDNSIVITRDDTGEIIRERIMSADERQMGLDLPVEAEFETGPDAEAEAEAGQE